MITTEVKPEADGKFGLYINGTLIGTSKLHCDATLAGEVIKKAAAPTRAEEYDRQRGWAARNELEIRGTIGTGEMGQ